ncbi:hypothetical protein [Paenibacillus sp. S150]|uniref:hypothetical protein n=1 Tax=Paenibacillus sp. S150 TaxID=2749826 RepID=UPI00281565B7|nr:hypothetical protein [Paenibacillus sp. S150]
MIKPSLWQKEWSAVKAAHSSWFSAIDFWTAGLLSQTKEYARISQEDPWSAQHFANAALLMMSFWPGGRIEKETADLTATIWGRITATQALRKGTNIPTSFVLEDITVNGQKLWVHGNATKHMEEYINRESAKMLSNDARRMIEQSMLTSLESAIKGLDVKMGREMYNINGWQIGIDVSEESAVVFHAVYNGGK